MPHLLAALWFLVCLGACLGYGRFWLRLLRYPLAADPLRAIYAAALGMGTLAYLVLGIGLLGALTRPAIVVLVTVGIVLLALCLRDRGGSTPDAKPAHDPRDTPSGDRLPALGCLILLGLMLLATLAGAFRPVDGLEWDSLSYHLAAPKIYLREGRIPLIIYDSHTDFPFTMGMLYTVGLAFGSTASAKLFHWSAGWLTAAAIGLWTSRRTVGGRPVPMWAGPLAAALFAGMPIVLWELGTAYVDLGTALFQFLALAALINGTRFHGTARPTRIDPAAPILAGLLTGFALGTKYTALLQFGLLGLGLLFLVAKVGAEERKSAVGAVLRFVLVSAAIASPWYLKNWLWVHNPVYPFFFSLFPQSFSWTKAAADAYASEQGTFGLGKGPGSAATLFWNLGVHGREFYINQRVVMGDVLGSLGPWWAGLLPLLAWARGLGWQAWAMLLYSLASVGMWFFLSQQSRYLLPVFAPLAAVLALGIAALPSVPARSIAGFFVAVALALSLWMHQPLVSAAMPVLTGQVTEQEYLRGSERITASLPGLYEASEWVNTLPEESRIAMYQETRGFYMDRRYFWANPLQHNLIPYEELSTGAELATHLRKFGITHVLINYDFARGAEKSQWCVLLRDGIRSGVFQPAFASERALPDRQGVMVYVIR